MQPVCRVIPATPVSRVKRELRAASALLARMELQEPRVQQVAWDRRVLKVTQVLEQQVLLDLKAVRAWRGPQVRSEQLERQARQALAVVEVVQLSRW